MSMFSLILPGRNPTSTPVGATSEAMSSTSSDLEGLRRRLDEIDDRLQDLLIDRAEIVSMVAASKKGGNQPAFQPAREAEIIRRLVERHHGAFPIATLVRMWREMLAATVRLQSPFSVAVFAPADRHAYWDLARDHYGSCTPMTAYCAVGAVIGAVAAGATSVGVLPMPRPSEADPWWPLLSSKKAGPRVIARLPFVTPGGVCTDGVEALAIGYGTQQASGLDRTLWAMECSAEINRERVTKLLSDLGLECNCFLTSRFHGPVDLIELEGFVPSSEPRLEAFRTELGSALHRLVPLGGYAVPLSPSAKG
jgi:chorismate mutase/prephenate dehydratase